MVKTPSVAPSKPREYTGTTRYCQRFISISRQSLPVKRTIVLPWSLDPSSDVQ